MSVGTLDAMASKTKKLKDSERSAEMDAAVELVGRRRRIGSKSVARPESSAPTSGKAPGRAHTYVSIFSAIGRYNRHLRRRSGRLLNLPRIHGQAPSPHRCH